MLGSPEGTWGTPGRAQTGTGSWLPTLCGHNMILLQPAPPITHTPHPESPPFKACGAPHPPRCAVWAWPWPCSGLRTPDGLLQKGAGRRRPSSAPSKYQCCCQGPTQTLQGRRGTVGSPRSTFCLASAQRPWLGVLGGTKATGHRGQQSPGMQCSGGWGWGRVHGSP